MTTTIDTTRPGVPFGRLVRVELRKMTDTRAGRTLVIVTGAIVVLTVAVILLVAALNDSFNMSADDIAQTLQFVSLLILPVFAIMITTSEWNQRTHLTTFTLEPMRSRIITAKAVAVLAFSIVTLVLCIALGAVGNAATGAFDYQPVWNVGVGDLLWAVGRQFALIFSAFALGLVLLNTASAIAVFYVSAIMLRFIVYPILFGFIDVFRDIAPYLDVFFGFTVAQYGEHIDGGTVTGLERFAPVVVSVILWVVVPGVIGWLRANRSELK